MEAEEKSRIVISDWAGPFELEPRAKDRDSLIWQLIIQSLLYDEVLIQDQVLVCSSKLAEWFTDEEAIPLLRDLFDMGSIVVLKHPLKAYGDDDLSDLASEWPVLARSKFIEKHSSVADKPFRPDERQKEFHKVLEACLRRDCQRFAGDSRDFHLPDKFGLVLTQCLGLRTHQAWRERNFPGISPGMVADFIEFIESPAKALERLKTGPRGGAPNPLWFNTALGDQVAATYRPEEAKSMIELIESCMAHVFACGEAADERFGGGIYSVLTACEKQDLETEPEVIVQSIVQSQLNLPLPRKGFGKAIREVREDAAGKNLRKSIKELGATITFDDQKERWSEVAELMATKLPTTKEIQIFSVAGAVGRGMVFATLMTALTVPFAGFAALALAATAEIPVAIGAECFMPFIRKVRGASREYELAKNLNDSVDFGCVAADLPETVEPETPSRPNRGS